jgi:hypothetical protein
VTPIPNGITTFTTDSFNKALITSSIIINIIASLVFGPSANTSPVTIPASDCLDIILDKIDSDDSPGLKFEPNNINGGGSGAIGILGTVLLRWYLIHHL